MPRNDCPNCHGHGYTIRQIGVDEYGDAIGEQEQCGCYYLNEEEETNK